MSTFDPFIIVNNKTNTYKEFDNYYRIELTLGQAMFIDKEDFHLIQKHKYYAQKSKNSFYAQRTDTQTNKAIRIHNEIMNFQPTYLQSIDHINLDSLDNRKVNLRICTAQQQAINQKIKSNNTSGITGVSQKINKKGVKWLARQGRKKRVFDTQEEAILFVQLNRELIFTQ